MADEKLFNNAYEVGYRKPPMTSQFAKGRSGNPKGRPKGSKNLATIVRQEGRQTVRLNGPKGSRLVNKNQAVVMQLGNQAAQGNLAAARVYLSLVQMSEQQGQEDQSTITINESDTVVMQSIAKRLQKLSASVPGADDVAESEGVQ